MNLARHPGNLSQWLTPIDYARYREFEFALNAIKRYCTTPQKILDIGSPKLLAMSLAASMPDAIVHSVDIQRNEVRLLSDDSKRLKISNLVSGIHDARCLAYPDNGFDLILSLSVFEHIAPEHEGDMPASKELGRVMAPNGIAILTVPFSRVSFAEYKMGRVYERTPRNMDPIFFQRFYDYDMLMSNIVRVSGLEVLYLEFIEERYFYKDQRKRMARYINSSPKRNFFFGPWFPLLSRIFLSSPKELERCRKPYIACLVLKKS